MLQETNKFYAIGITNEGIVIWETYKFSQINGHCIAPYAEPTYYLL